MTASGKYAAYDSGAIDGTEVAAGIAYSNVDASAADADIVVVARDCEVMREELIWPTGQGSTKEVAGGVTELNGLGIMLR